MYSLSVANSSITDTYFIYKKTLKSLKYVLYTSGNPKIDPAQYTFLIGSIHENLRKSFK